MQTITPVILAGGSGTRLWPLSRKSNPKQFSAFVGNKTLFQQSVMRLLTSNELSCSRTITVTNSAFRFLVEEQLKELEVDPGDILIEPDGRNTGPAILAASLYASRNGENPILVVAPSDHLIPDTEEFHAAIRHGINEAVNGKLVVFGVKPHCAHTGYGYLEVSKGLTLTPQMVDRFVEKPSKADAKKMFESSKYFWNSGIFMFCANDIVAAFREHLPDMITPVEAAIENGSRDLGFFRLQADAWMQCMNISLDYAVMEKATNISVVPLASGWSDLGDWNSVWEQMEHDESGNHLSNNAHALDCKNVLLRSESSQQELVGIGLEDVVAIAMPDAVLVAKRDDTQNVKNAVALLKAKKIGQAEVAIKDHRPWGWFESLIVSERFQVKRILVNPKASLSLQSHFHRSEHWVVVEGTATVTLESSEQLLSEGQSIYIPLGMKHRLENPGKVPLVIIEVQTGTYLGEDDIIRYEDLYARE